jgi:hypothetical protein
MNNKEIETGLLKEKIKELNRHPEFNERIESDNDLNRLRTVYEYLIYRVKKRQQISKMNFREYKNYCKVELDRMNKE